jgi:hypothetical protein
VTLPAISGRSLLGACFIDDVTTSMAAFLKCSVANLNLSRHAGLQNLYINNAFWWIMDGVGVFLVGEVGIVYPIVWEFHTANESRWTGVSDQGHV